MIVNNTDTLYLTKHSFEPRPFSYAKEIFHNANDLYWYCEFFNGHSLHHLLNQEVLPLDMIEQIKNKSVVLVLNNAHEAFHTVVETIYELLVKRLQLPPTQILLVSESAIINVEVQKIAEKNNLDKIKTSWMRVFEYDVKNTIHNDIVTLENKTYTKKFLNFNRRWRMHRPTLVALLEINNILTEGHVSLVKDVEGSGWEKFFNSAKHSFANNINFCNLLIDNEQKIKSIPDLYLDQSDMNINHAAHFTDSTDKYYSDTYFSVITETNFFKQFGEGVFVSEKIFRPILKKHPFILVSRPKTLQYLKSIGYQTFNPIINEQYDNIEDDYERMLFIANEIKRLCTLSNSELTIFLNTAKKIVDFNYNKLQEKTTFISELN